MKYSNFTMIVLTEYLRVYKEILWPAPHEKDALENEEVKIELRANSIYKSLRKSARRIEEVTIAFRAFNANFISETS